MGGVGQFQHRLANNLDGRLRAEANGFVAIRRDDGELLDYEPVQVLALYLLTSNIIKREGVEIGEQDYGISGDQPVGGELLLSPQSVEIIKFGDPGRGR